VRADETTALIMGLPKFIQLLFTLRLALIFVISFTIPDSKPVSLSPSRAFRIILMLAFTSLMSSTELLI